MNKQENTISFEEVLADLEYEILLLESELKNCENQELGESLFNQLVAKKAEFEILVDTQGA